MFDKDFRITGKHAFYWKDLCELPGNTPDRDQHSNFKIFKAYIDAYILCPIIGFQYGRKSQIDNSIKCDAGMLSEILTKRQAELKYVYQIIMLADEESEPDLEKRIRRATTFSEDTPEEKKAIKENMEIFNGYFLGGLEVMHEQFFDKCIDEDDYLKMIHDFTVQFSENQNTDSLKEKIDKYING